MDKLSLQMDILFFFGALCLIWASYIIVQRFNNIIRMTIAFRKEPKAQREPAQIQKVETYRSADWDKRPIAKKYIVLDESIPAASPKETFDTSQPTLKIASLMRKRPLLPTGVA